jgi:hypothetical protein
MDLDLVLGNEHLASSVSDEGPLSAPRYSTNYTRLQAGNATPPQIPFSGFRTNSRFSEVCRRWRFEPGVELEINAPMPCATEAGEIRLEKPATLVFYALPNGNTIAWTKGKKKAPEEDWHYEIQHIGAQTRFLRQLFPDRAVVVAYLEAEGRSWPAWRRKHGDSRIPALISDVRRLVSAPSVEVVLNGHSGGGSLIFGYLNAIQAVPREVKRICFLDSNYAYDASLKHGEKLADWLKSETGRHLVVLAYNDAVALLNGTNFVSASGGTWGRSLAMRRDLSKWFEFSSRTNGDLETWITPDRRLQFELLENPARKVLHTVQVERNGFIHSMLSGTPLENEGYRYLGDRAYSDWIDPE